MSWALRLLVLGTVLASSTTSADADFFTEGNLLVFRERFSWGEPTMLHEYTPEGAHVRSVEVGPQAAARGLALDQHGRALMYYGTFSPQLRGYDPTSGQWSARTQPGWSSVNNLRYGGLSVYGNYAYATNMSTAGGGRETGIVRFNLTDNTSRIFHSSPPHGNQFVQMTTGYDGFIYALTGGFSPQPRTVKVYDPISMEQVRSFDAPISIRDLAVTAEGDHFYMGADGWLHHYDPAGALVKSLDTSGPGGMVDIDLGRDGTIVLTSHGGAIIVTDTTMTGFTQFHSGYAHTPGWLGDTSTARAIIIQEPVPEPTGALLLGTVVLATMQRRSPQWW